MGQEMLAFLRRSTSVKPAPASTPSTPSCNAAGSVSSDTCPCPGQRVRVEGLSKSPHYNGLFARVEVRLEGGRYRVVMEQGGKVLSLKADNLVVVPVDLVPVGKDEPSEPRR